MQAEESAIVPLSGGCARPRHWVKPLEWRTQTRFVRRARSRMQVLLFTADRSEPSSVSYVRSPIRVGRFGFPRDARRVSQLGPPAASSVDQPRWAVTPVPTGPLADEARRDALTDKRSQSVDSPAELTKPRSDPGADSCSGEGRRDGPADTDALPRTADTRVRCLKTSPNRPPTGTAVRRPPGHRTFFTEASAGQPLTTKPTAKRAPSGIVAIGNPLLRIPDLRGKVGRTEHCANQAEIVVTGSPVAL